MTRPATHDALPTPHGRSALVVLLVALAGVAEAQTPCAIQGTAATSTLQGSRVTTAGVVTADFTATSLQGFFVQDPSCDTDPATSNALFVATGSRRPAVPVGHRVTVVGRVVESFGLTGLEFESLTDSGAFPGVLEVATLDVPADTAAAVAYLEAREGMLVAPPRLRVVAATNHYGEAWAMPESAGLERLFRGGDDPRKLGLAAPASWLALDHGDRVSDTSGVLGYTYGAWKLLLPAGRTPLVEKSGITPAQNAAATGDPLAIAAWNLENLLDAVDDPGKSDEVVSAGDYAAGLARRARSIATSLGLPDLLAVAEAEKIEVLQDLANQPELAGVGYRAVLVEGPDSRGIDVGALYNPARLELRAFEPRQSCTGTDPGTGLACPSGSGFALFARPPLVVQLTVIASGERLALIANHFKAQDSSTGTDENLRLAQAEAVRALAAELKAADPTVSVIVVGDLNDFEDSPPLARLVSDGRLVDLTARAAGGRAFTYTFDGLAQVLDYVLVDAALVSRVAEYLPVHANVDFGAPGPGADGPHASDHDAVLLRLRLR
ncbi:MAG: endonuclease/exonuclease/phosphatase family protein [Vicinamibacteria bacterium]|nr:endonuclease/exonuclease/phosphatase family protein [Vicinamibacteria bacterium]